MMYNVTDAIRPLIIIWNDYFAGCPGWEKLVEGITPKVGACGPVYEMPMPFDRPDQSYAIADMRGLPFSAPHYHKETEIYFVLEGSGLVVVGGDEIVAKKGDVIVTSPDTAHFVIPQGGLVLGVISTPPFQGELPVTETDLSVKFNKAQFERLTASCCGH